jgi:3-phytase
MDGATRIWLDDPNPIFRMGLAASLRDPRFVVVGESAGLVPPPPLDDVDVLVFDLGEQSGDCVPGLPALGRRQRRSTRLVGLVPGGDPEAAHGQCTVLVRSELTPEGLRDCLASVVAAAPAPVGPAVARAVPRLRRLLRRKGALAAVVVALAAGAFGPTGRAEGLSDAPVAASAAAETTPVQSDGDAAGDAAVWINGSDPGASLVFGTDKRGALESYDLAGNRVQRLVRPAGITDVDVRGGFPLGGRNVALVGTGGRTMAFFRVDGAARQLREVGAHDFPAEDGGAGFCLYRSAVTGRFYAFVTEADGDAVQYELFDQGGLVDAREVRTWPLGRRAEHCVADDETGRLFVSQAKAGVTRYDAEPDASPLARQEVDRVGGRGHLDGEVAGLALVAQPGKRGFLIASSAGDDSFAVYRRGQTHGWLGQRQVTGGTAADGCSATEGIEAVAANLGPRFPAGIFICQDGSNTPPGSTGHQNFKYVRLEQIIDAASLPS